MLVRIGGYARVHHSSLDPCFDIPISAPTPAEMKSRYWVMVAVVESALTSSSRLFLATMSVMRQKRVMLAITITDRFREEAEMYSDFLDTQMELIK